MWIRGFGWWVGALLAVISGELPHRVVGASLWQTAVEDPRACSDNAPLPLLQKVAPEHVDAWCIHSPCDGSGWALHASGCWKRVPVMANDGCAATPKVVLSAATRRGVECPAPCSPDKDLWLDHCNAFAMLRRQYCNDGRCATCSQAMRCKAHFQPPNAECDPIPFGDQPNDVNCAPRVIIIGTMKCGTNTLGAILSHHPDVALNRCAGIHCAGVPQKQRKQHWQGTLDKKHDLVWEQPFPVGPNATLRGYARLLAQNDATNVITFAKYPGYMDIGAPGHNIIAALMPNVRVVGATCDPTERAYSELHHTVRHGQAWEHLFTRAGVPWSTNFSEVVGQILPLAPRCIANSKLCARLRAHTIDKGLFAERFAPWRKVLGMKRVLVTRMEDSREQTTVALLAFAGLRPMAGQSHKSSSSLSPSFANKAYGGRSEVWTKHAATTRLLADYFKSRESRGHHQGVGETVERLL